MHITTRRAAGVLLAIGCIAPDWTLAQDTQPATAPARDRADAVPSTAPLPDGKILFTFKDASLDAVLNYLAETAGLVIVSETKVEARINVVSRRPMTIDDAVSVLNTLLKEKGYTAVRTEKTLRIVALDSAKKASIPVRSGAEPRDVKANDDMQTQVIPIRFADAVQLKKDLAPLIPPYADLSANASSNSLIVTDTGSNVRRVMEIVRSLDTTLSSVVQVKVFSLKHANATSAARLITEVFKVDTAQQNPNQTGFPGFGRFFGGGGPGGGQAGAAANADGTRQQPKVTASADERTNNVVVSAPPDTMRVIEDVIKNLDSDPTQDQAVFIYYLKNAQARNLESVVNSIFNPNGTTPQRNTGTNAGSTNTLSQRTGPGQTAGGTNRTGTGQNTGGFGTLGGAGMTQNTNRNIGTSTAAPRLSSGASQTAADMAGQVTVVADTDTNSLLVMTSSSNFERVKKVLAELDRSVPQVLIKVLLAEVSHDNDRDLGVEFSAINLKTSGKTTIFTDMGLDAATKGLTFKLVEPDVQVALHALEKVGKLDVLSRPYILASDNQAAAITVGQEVPFITNSRITDTGQTVNTVEYKDIGIILQVTPHINPDGLVIMDVAPEISTLTGDTVDISDTVKQPIIAKRAAQSRVAVKDGQTIVIGGLMEDRKTQTVQKVPFVGDIPVLGWLFTRDEKKKGKTELLIFLTPHVAKDSDRLGDISNAEKAGAEVVPTAVDKGIYEKHLQGLQRGAATQPATKPVEPKDADSTP